MAGSWDTRSGRKGSVVTPEGIFTIYAELRIAADSEAAARDLVERHRIAQHLCTWRKNADGTGGYLYVGGELFIDTANGCFKLSDRRSDH